MEIQFLYKLFAIPILWIYYGNSMDIYYGFIYAIANSMVWISLLFSQCFVIGESGVRKRPNYPITGVLYVTLRHV
jgi:hypothetical protein